MFRSNKLRTVSRLLQNTKQFVQTKPSQTFVSRSNSDDAEGRAKALQKAVDKVLTNSGNEDAVTTELRFLSETVHTKEDFAHLLRLAAKTSGQMQYWGHLPGRFKKDPVRVAVTGAAGQIGYSLLFRIASGEMLGDEQPVILHLIEQPEALKALEGVVMELEDGAFPLIRGIVQTADLNQGFKDVDYALLVGAKPRTKGMQRGDLLRDNAKIFSTQGKALNDNAKKTCLTLVVGNPANTNALIAASNAPNIPPENFSAMTRLDHDRAIAQLALKTKSDVVDIQKVAIWGNHSATQYPDISSTTIKGKPAKDLVDDKWLRESFIPTVQNRGAQIIEARGSSSAASAADAAIKHMNSWVLGSEDWVSMAVPSDGSYGVAKGVYTSYPVICKGNGKYEIVQGLKLDEFSKQKIDASVKELNEEKNAIKDLLKK